MKELICTNSGDCLQLCRALDDVSKFNFAPQDGAACEWPRELDITQTKEVDSLPNGKLLRALGVGLGNVLDAHLEAPSQISIEADRGLAAIEGVFDKQLALFARALR